MELHHCAQSVKLILRRPLLTALDAIAAAAHAGAEAESKSQTERDSDII